MNAEAGLSKLRVFVSYAHKDEAHKVTFLDQLIDLERSGQIELWHDRELQPGSKWYDEILAELDRCDIAVFLISQAFIRSEFIYREEFSRLQTRHAQGDVELFPVLLSPCGWLRGPLADYQVLPEGGKPITANGSENGEREQAWTDIGDAFAEMVQRLRSAPVLPAAQAVNPAPEPAPQPVPEPPRRDPSFGRIVRALDRGSVAFFIGEGVNRPASANGAPTNASFPPCGPELTEVLARAAVDMPPERAGLAEVAQRVVMSEGIGPVYDELHDAFDADFTLPDVHRDLARLIGTLRASGRLDTQPVFLTVNYDDLIERAFEEAGEPLDVLAYSVDEAHRGIFTHIPPSGPPVKLTRANEYVGLPSDERPLLLKLAGTVSRNDAGHEHFVVTEEDHFSYEFGEKLHALLPPALVKRLSRSHCVFLGHALSHWTLRAVIYRVFGRGRLPARSWVVGEEVASDDLAFWDYLNAEALNVQLDQFVDELSGEFTAQIEPTGS